MEIDAKNVTIRELRQEEESEARDIVVSAFYREIVTVRTARVLLTTRAFFWQVYGVLGFLMTIFYAVSNSAFVSVFLTAISSLPVSWGMIYIVLRLSVHGVRMELNHLYSWYSAKAGSRFWVAVYGGKIIGTAALDRTSDTEAELKRMSVLAEYRRRGVATRLMKRFEEFCRSDGVKKMFLITSDFSQHGERLYEKSGFVVTNTTSPNIRMEKLLLLQSIQP